MKKLLVIAERQTAVEAWRRMHGFQPQQLRRVLGWQHIAGESIKSAALLFLGTGYMPDGVIEYVQMYSRLGMKQFGELDASDVRTWLEEP